MKTALLALSLLISNAVSAVTLDELQRRFSQQPVVRAEFSQSRQISGMAQPLRSGGELMISRDNGLWWQQQQPFPLTMVLSDQRMVQVMAGQAPQIITAQSNPQMFQFNHLLRALFQADHTVLAQNFRIDFHDLGDQRWQLLLTPKTAPLDKLFNTIRLQGRVYLDNIMLDDRQGDRTEIRLCNQRVQPESLSHDEQQRFVF